MIKDMFREAVNPLDQPVMAKTDFAIAAAEMSSAPTLGINIPGVDHTADLSL